MEKWDWRAIFTSVLLSFTFWVFHSLNAEHTANIKLPIQLKAVNKDSLSLVVVVPPPKYIKVNVTGNGWTLLRKTFGIGLESLNIELNNPLNENYIATRSQRTSIDEILQEMKTVNYLLEDSIFFDFDTLTEKKIQLTLPLDTISLEIGYRITSDVIIVPSELKLIGPASELINLPDTIALGLEDEEINDSYEEEIDLPIQENPLISADYDNVNVMFDVGLFMNQQMQVPVSVINFPKGKPYEINPPEAILDYFILETEEITQEDYLLLLLDYENYNAADSTIKPTIYLPAKMKDVVTKPSVFKVIFK